MIFNYEILKFCILIIYVQSLCSEEINETICKLDDLKCLKDPEGFQAIAQLHSLIDDDKDGNLDRNESLEFFRDDLKKNTDGSGFHKYDDFISVNDLWTLWSNSETFNWTIGDTVNWLINSVELPQYKKHFIDNAIDGKAIPRFAAFSQSFASKIGIRSPVHRQKLSIKATDLVLFGPPKIPYNFQKDVAVVFSLLVGLAGCLYAYRQQNQAKQQMLKVMKDLGSLQNAEDALSQMQTELENAQKEQKLIADDKKDLERRLETEMRLSKTDLRSGEENSEFKHLEDELMKTRMALFDAEKRLEENNCLPLHELQVWLQLTYEVEQRYFDSKRDLANKELASAKEMGEKIRRQKSKFLGSFRVAHTTFLDETDQQIMNVKNSMEALKLDLQEKSQRWMEIEKICNCNIINNPGYEHLQKIVASNQFYDNIRSQMNVRSPNESIDDVSDSLNKSCEDSAKLFEGIDQEPNHNKINFSVGSDNAVVQNLAKQSSKDKLLLQRLNHEYNLPKSRSFVSFDSVSSRNQPAHPHSNQITPSSNNFNPNHASNYVQSHGNQGNTSSVTPEDQKSDSASESANCEERPKKKNLFKFRK